MGHFGVHERRGARHSPGPGFPHTGIAVLVDLFEEGRNPLPGQPEKGPGQQVRRGRRGERPDHVLQGQRVDDVQRKTPANLPAVHVQTVRDRVHLFPAEPVFRTEHRYVLRGRRDKGQQKKKMITFYSRPGRVCTHVGFSSHIFQDSGSTIDKYAATIVLGIIRLIFTIIGCVMMRRLGRKPLSYISSTYEAVFYFRF